MKPHWKFFLVILYLGFEESFAQVRMDTISLGWSKTSVNTVIFRKNSVVTHGDFQYAAYYNERGVLMLAKRRIGKDIWQVKQTPYSGNVADAHNSISIMVDGQDYLHVAWNHHNTKLQYCTSVAPGSLELTATKSMIGENENDVTYPEFLRLPSGDLIFLYRSGESGRGNLVMNRYEVHVRKWRRVQTNLVDGEQERSAYWQAFVDQRGSIHLSWVWRETSDVATNHDLCYARSDDVGYTWKKTTGELYSLPIRVDHAEYAWRIPTNSELINQASMYVDYAGRIYIATYWRPWGDVPQYFLLIHDGTRWKAQQISKRALDFSLSGEGTKKIPISRPQVLVQQNGEHSSVIVLFRDEERGNRVSMTTGDPLAEEWITKDLTNVSVGSWEPSYDTELWRTKNILQLFVQRTEQGDGEKMENIPPQPVLILNVF